MNMAMAHDHHAMSSRNDKLIAVAADCALKANVCLQHCLVLLGQGDKSMAACAKSSSQAAAICTALQQLASAESGHLPQLAKVAMDICKECEEECKKTEQHPVQGSVRSVLCGMQENRCLSFLNSVVK